MQNAKPHVTVSVVIPVYNRANLVPRAIRSVLDQTCEDFELLVVDDGSTDDLAGTLSTLTDPRLRVIVHDENRGAAAARNTGISEACGDYVAFLDSDDYWLPRKLERQLEFMRSFNGVARVACTAHKMISSYYPEGEDRFAAPAVTEAHLQTGCRLSPGATLMAERLLFHEVGPMNEDLPRLEDWDWLLRCVRISEPKILNEVLSVIDYSAAEHPNYAAVKSSVEIMKHVHFKTSGLLPTIGRLRFLSALQNELAATDYRNRRYGRACWHLLRSLLWFPYRDLDFFRRVGYAIVHDRFRGTSR